MLPEEPLLALKSHLHRPFIVRRARGRIQTERLNIGDV